jgi:signal transduction histidine kinase
VRVVGDTASAQLADRPAVAAPAGALAQRGRPRVGLDWVVRSPVRMLVVIALIVGVPVNVFGQFLADNARDDFREVALAKVDGGAYAGANLVGERMSAVRYRTEAVAGRPRLRSFMATREFEALERLLGEELLLYSNDVNNLFVLDAGGQFVASYPAQGDLYGVDFSRTSYYIGATSPPWHPVVSPVEATQLGTSGTSVTVAVPIFDEFGVEPVGLLCASMDLSRARVWLAPITLLFDQVYVVDDKGRVIFGDERVDATPLRDLTSDPNVAAAMAGRHVRHETADVYSGQTRFLASSAVAGLGWNVFVGDSPAPTTQRLAALTDGLLLLRLILLGLLLAGGVLLSLTTLRQQRLALANLTRLNKAKSDFVSVVSHEFRTPLTGIQGFSEMIRDERLSPEEVRDFANDINADAKRLARMITDMLDLDRMESGRVVMNRELIDLAALITDQVERHAATSAQHRLVLELAPGVRGAWADRDRVTQVMTNLLSNAVKYSPNGGVVTVGLRAEKDMAHITVRDQGLGIAAGSLEEVFERYSRLHTTKQRTIQGTGLGLPIVREICKMHGGHAWVESTVGEGSTFHVTIPFDQRGDKG